jgi:hypothetical protein
MSTFIAGRSKFRRFFLAGALAVVGLAGWYEISTPVQPALAAGDDRFANSRPRLFAPLRLSGPVATHVIQGQDVSRDGFLYVMQLGKGDAYITKLDLNGNQIKTLVVQNPGVHQSMFIEDTAQGRYFWMGGSKEDSRRLVRAREADGSTQEFPIDFSRSVPGSWGGGITAAYDRQSGLVVIRAVRMQRPKENWIFTYRLADIKRGPSARAIHAFRVDLTDSFQGIATDGQRIWIRLGGTAISGQKPLNTYTLDGAVVGRRVIAPGLSKAMSEGNKFESEGISFYRDSDGGTYLTMIMETGQTGRNIHRLYILPDTQFSAGSRRATPFSAAVQRATPSD